MIASTAPALTAPDLQAQANQPPQRHDRPTVAVADPHRPSALRTGRLERNQDLLVRRLHTAPTPGHLQPPCSTPPDSLNRQPVLPFLFFWTAAGLPLCPATPYTSSASTSPSNVASGTLATRPSRRCDAIS